PSDVRVVNAADHRAVWIAVAISIPMVIHMMARPPQRTFLHRRSTNERPDEARHAVHLKRTMGKIPMERERQSDGAEEFRNSPERDESRRKRHKENEECRKLDDPEHNSGRLFRH